jgi:hypothetical protein
LQRTKRVVGEPFDRLELLREVAVEIRPLKRRGGESGDRRDRRAEPVLVRLDVVDP